MIDRFLRSTCVQMTAYCLLLTVVMGCKPPSAVRPGSDVSLNDARVVFIGPSSDDSQWQGIVGGAKRYLREYTMLQVEYTASAQFHATDFLDTVGTIAATSPRVIALYHRDREILTQAARTARDAHVRVITIGDRTDVQGLFGHVEEDIGGAAELLGLHLDQIAGDRKSYFLLHCQSKGRRGKYFYRQFIDKARDYHALTLLKEGDACDGKQTADALIRALFTEFPNAGFVVTLDSVIDQEGMMDALHARPAPFATVGAAPALWPDLRSGKALALAGVNDGELGAAAAELVVAALTDSRQPGAFKLVESELITAETLPDFVQRYTAATGLQPEEGQAQPTSAPSSQAIETP